MTLKISIVVPTYNRAGQLENLLRSFSKMKDINPYEVIIVDDRSTDNTEAIINRWCSFKHPFKTKYVVMERNGGPAKARNKGILESEGDAIAFTDSDCSVHPHWIKYLLRGLENDNGHIGIGGRVLPLGNDIFSKYYTFHRILEPPQSRKYLVSANCIYWREPILEAGGFDEDITRPGGEDIGLSFKLFNRGYRFGFEDKAIVYHDYRSNIRNFSKTFYNYGLGCRLVTEKYFGGGNGI